MAARDPDRPWSGHDLTDETQVRRAVAAYAESRGAEIDRWHFDQDRATQAILFYPRHLRFTKGKWALKPFPLETWQAFDVIAPAFGWIDDDGLRRYLDVDVWVPRKNGKTEMLAGVGIIHLVADGEQGGEVYSVATKEEQARIVFDAGRTMLRRSPTLLPLVRVFETGIWCDALSSVWRPLGKSSTGSHGKGPSALLGDEIHEWPDDRLWQFLAQGMGARRQPMRWKISTAGIQSGFGWEQWNIDVDLARGALDNDRALVAIYAAGADDDPYDPATWRKANPNLGVSLSLDYMEAEAKKARTSIRHENDFKRYHLNMWVGQAERAIRIEDWDKGGTWKPRQRPRPWADAFDDMAGRPCFVGVDLASNRDMNAAAYVFPPSTDDRWRVLMRYWIPDADLDDRSRQSRVPFDRWVHEGAIIATPGNVTDYDEIERQLTEDADRLQIIRIGFDPWNATQMMIRLNTARPTAKAEDAFAVKVPQTLLHLAGAWKLIERLIYQGRLIHYGHPVLRWNAANVALSRPDRNDNVLPAKDRSANKIDGIAATVTATALAAGSVVEADSYLASSSMIVI